MPVAWNMCDIKKSEFVLYLKHHAIATREGWK